MHDFTLVPKVSEALWERTREAKLRFGGGRVSIGSAIGFVARWKGDGVSTGQAFPKRCANFGNEMGAQNGLRPRRRSLLLVLSTYASAIWLSFTLVPKVSEALWERTREAKLRFGGGR
jgi:hypothetical protein